MVVFFLVQTTVNEMNNMRWMFEIGKPRCDDSVEMKNMRCMFEMGNLRCDGSVRINNMRWMFET